ncbi:conserved unknown protein [Ectocarpus siliculosus]|uniref:Uncharacterized protein n=1 Tax=Ectocarpus siliculosus TaxID=2880 RepID=D8LDK9_ECTSI|nr:conserved unknown protein [Ectocarpus siliculosus]|eukprot:CBN74083.1 conserved unknown protein [Ectocarpus siliculosus]
MDTQGGLNVGQQQSEQPASRRKQQTILVAGGSRGPRPPSNHLGLRWFKQDRERKWAELPEYHPDEHLLFFAHIIKTSGTSLSFVLRDIFGEEAVVPTSHESGYMKLGEVQGHDDNWWAPYEAVTYAHNEEDKHRCVYGHAWVKPEKGGDHHDEESCNSLKASGKHNAILEEYYDRMAESAIKRLGDGLWVGVTERSDEADCLLFLTLGKGSTGMGSYRHKEPRPISVWHEAAMSKVTQYDQADWKVFNAANDILDLRIWTARERLKHAGEEELERLGKHCVNVINGQ